MRKTRTILAIICALALACPAFAQEAIDLKVLKSEEDYGMFTNEEELPRTTTEEWEEKNEATLNILSQDKGDQETVTVGWDGLLLDNMMRYYKGESYGEIDGKEFRGSKKIILREYWKRLNTFIANGMFSGVDTSIEWKEEDVAWEGTTKSEYDVEVNENDEILRTGKIKTNVLSRSADLPVGYMEIDSKIKGDRAEAHGHIEYLRGASRHQTKSYSGEISLETYAGEDGTRSGYGCATLTSEDGRHRIFLNYDMSDNNITVDYTVTDRYLLDAEQGSYEYTGDEPNPFADIDRLARKFHFLDVW